MTESVGYYRQFSIISICHNRWSHLAESWISWCHQDYPRVQRIVVVSGEQDSSNLLRESGFDGVIIRVHNCPYFRPSFLRNLGLLAATGEYLGFVDADITLHPSWVSHCVSLLRRSSDLLVRKDLYEQRDPGGASGTCAISRWLFEKIRGYNENLDLAWGYEDTDLYLRGQRAGGRFGAYSISLVTHRNHDDVLRGQYFRERVAPRTPRLLVQHMRTCDLDAAVHPYEANRVRRVSFPPVNLDVRAAGEQR